MHILQDDRAPLGEQIAVFALFGRIKHLDCDVIVVFDR